MKRRATAKPMLLGAALLLCSCSALPPGGALALGTTQTTSQQAIRPSFAARDTAAQADGRTVVFGHRGADYVMARYLAGGQPDPSFGGSGEVRLPRTAPGGAAEIFRLTVQAGGGLLALGGTTVLRVLPDGRPDPAFGQGGRVTAALPAAPQALAALPDGRVLVAGGTRALSPDPAAPASALVLTRLLPGGAPDPGFGVGGQVVTALDASASAFSVWPLADGGALVGGTALSFEGGTYSRWVVVRYTAGGALDPAFGDGGVATVRGDRFAATRPSSLAVDASGRVLSAGHLSSGVCTLDRLLPSGQRDPAWAYEAASELRVLPDGNAVGGAGAGTPDVSLALLPGGGAALGGCAQFTPDASGQDQVQPVLARLGPDGSPDLTLGSQGFQTVPDSARASTTPGGGLLVGLDPVSEIDP
ncbi:NHL repeat-containing protein [Deinococcus aerolatus]|nr:hypothetical protein [Deinococcus aerolatus]